MKWRRGSDSTCPYTIRGTISLQITKGSSVHINLTGGGSSLPREIASHAPELRMDRLALGRRPPWPVKFVLVVGSAEISLIFLSLLLARWEVGFLRPVAGFALALALAGGPACLAVSTYLVLNDLRRSYPFTWSHTAAVLASLLLLMVTAVTIYVLLGFE